MTGNHLCALSEKLDIYSSSYNNFIILGVFNIEMKAHFYKHFSNEAYRESLLHELSKEVIANSDDGLQRFCDININILNRHAPRKRKHARGNQMSSITKDLSKAIMNKLSYYK